MIRLYDLASGSLLHPPEGSTVTSRIPEQHQMENRLPSPQLQEVLPEPERRSFVLPPDLAEKSADRIIDEVTHKIPE